MNGKLKINKMAGAILVVGILMAAGFVTPALAKDQDNGGEEENTLKEARSLLQGWRDKLATEGATAEEVKEVIGKMEDYKQSLEKEAKNMAELDNINFQEMGRACEVVNELDARIEWEKYFLEECKKAQKEYREAGEKFNVENLNPLSIMTVYPTGGWKKTKRTSGTGGVYEADYNVNQRKGYAFSRSDNYNSGYGKSALYWETWWSAIPLHWQVQYNGQYWGYSSGHITFAGWPPLGWNMGKVDITYYVWDTYNGIKVRETRFDGYIANSLNMQYHGNSFHPTTDFWLGNNRIEKWEIGVNFKADSLAWGLADMTVNHYLPPNMCWQLNSIQITTL
ncbi:MAG: hypothetical protein U9O96_01015 [Candidatus Thermoplasmatota archaeon]|nr:hypothetical protein [Candidatus Thermoplasmatota archaeon]